METTRESDPYSIKAVIQAMMAQAGQALRMNPEGPKEQSLFLNPILPQSLLVRAATWKSCAGSTNY